MAAEDLGPVYTPGNSFRARAEARQREYRHEVLGVGWARHGHWLDEASAAGANFVSPKILKAAQERQAQGKGVGERTFNNMLSSQAMCFNIFAPLAADLELAAEVFHQVLPAIAEVRSITIEYTPPNEIFGDQSGRGGVDCDVLVEAVDTQGRSTIVVIETKFVEPEFSTCGFRAAGRAAKGQAVCPDDVALDADCSACLYSSRKGYKYWEQTWATGSLRKDALPKSGCPFAGPLWQLWVNHTLAHVEAHRRERAIFAVCAPVANMALDAPRHLESFAELVADRETVALIELDELVAAIGQVGRRTDGHGALAQRYCGI